MVYGLVGCSEPKSLGAVVHDLVGCSKPKSLGAGGIGSGRLL